MFSNKVKLFVSSERQKKNCESFTSVTTVSGERICPRLRSRYRKCIRAVQRGNITNPVAILIRIRDCPIDHSQLNALDDVF